MVLGVGYHGADYAGWQAQPHLSVDTVQGTLEAALGSVAATPVSTVCAGRTDTGVHGIGQVVHFDAPCARSQKAWVMGTNRNLPPSVRVNWAVVSTGDFHARFSALSRRYRYIIANTAVLSPHLAGLVTHYRRPLDVTMMQQASQVLVGEQDFSAFRAAQCQAAHAVRDIKAVTVQRHGDLVILEVEANAFLYHMVRNLAGALLLVGAGLRPVNWVRELLDCKDRTKGADTASASGLYLLGVTYPQDFGLPSVLSDYPLLGGLG